MMTKSMTLMFSIDKESSIWAVTDWLNGRIGDTDITKIDIDEKEVDLIFYGELYTYLAQVKVHSSKEVDVGQLKSLLKPKPHFIHELEFRLKA